MKSLKRNISIVGIVLTVSLMKITMKTKTKFKVNRLLQLILPSDRKEGYVKIYPNNTREHELVKFLICDKLKRRKFMVYTECRFVNNLGKPDIVCFSPDGEPYIIEVLKSESEDRFNEKLCKYPIDFDVIPVRTKDFKISEFEL